jgi:hypothetical protein
MTELERSYQRGFVVGQCDTYCEQVSAGAKLAAQLGCAKELLPEVEEAVAMRGCLSLVEERGFGRVGVWIFKHEFARQLITEYQDGGVLPKSAATYFMGKVFGYSDAEIIKFVEANISVRKA